MSRAMREQEKKRAAALAALEQVEPGRVIGIGTGSTTNYFIDALGAMRDRVAGAVASSRASAEKLERLGICLVDLNDVDELTLYVDGADEATRRRELIKGGGGALTREKIIAAAAERFICIVDDGKLVERLGSVGRTIEGLGGRPVLRDNCFTDNGNVILDVHGLTIEDPSALESELNQIPGVVANGLFGRRRADLLLVGEDTGVVAIWDDQE
jgi:ribose 5-phosphate isomerase A